MPEESSLRSRLKFRLTPTQTKPRSPLAGNRGLFLASFLSHCALLWEGDRNSNDAGHLCHNGNTLRYPSSTSIRSFRDAQCMSLHRYEYRGWQILITPRHTFICCPPAGEPLTVERECESLKIAFAEAKAFIDRMLIRCKLATLIDELLESGQITQEQHQQIDRLTGALVRACTSSHLESAQTLPPPLPESPSDSSPSDLA